MPRSCGPANVASSSTSGARTPGVSGGASAGFTADRNAEISRRTFAVLMSSAELQNRNGVVKPIRFL